jgi:hypothetical protein
MESVPNPSTATLANQTAMLDASGGSVTYIDNSSKSNSNTTQDTYNQQELSSDDKESTGGFFSKVIDFVF